MILGSCWQDCWSSKATNGPALWPGLPCKPNQAPENKEPKIEHRTAILSMSRVVRVKIIQWENIIQRTLHPLSVFDSIQVKMKQLLEQSAGFLRAFALPLGDKLLKRRFLLRAKEKEEKCKSTFNYQYN